jgi:8-oxo-dGTP pyrophosphatase MutT (NUDIX family)
MEEMITRHYSATGIVFNAENEILLVKHSKLKVWLPPGGHVDENELPEEAVLREIFEETGVRATIMSNKKGLPLYNDDRCRELETPFTVLLEDVSGNGTHFHIDIIFLCKAEDCALKKNPEEADEIGWFPYSQVKKLDTFDNVVKVIAQAVKDLQIP